MTLDEASAVMGWKAPKMSKIENASATIRPAEVASLLKAYGVTDPEVYGALESLARDAGKKGWWQTYSGVLAPAYADYISLESDAERICEWSPLLIPGLLQTAAYAREAIGGIAHDLSQEEIAALVEVRQARQAILTRPSNPLEFWAIIHEAALHQRFAVRPTTMRDQLRRLLDITELPNVTVQLMPLNSTVHPGVMGGFTMVTFAQGVPVTVLLEHFNGAIYIEGDDASPFATAIDHIRASALSVDDSLVRIADLEEGSRS